MPYLKALYYGGVKLKASSKAIESVLLTMSQSNFEHISNAPFGVINNTDNPLFWDRSTGPPQGREQHFDKEN